MLTCAECEYGNCNCNCNHCKYSCKYSCKKGVFIVDKNHITVTAGKCFNKCNKCSSFKQIID